MKNVQTYLNLFMMIFLLNIQQVFGQGRINSEQKSNKSIVAARKDSLNKLKQISSAIDITASFNYVTNNRELVTTLVGALSQPVVGSRSAAALNFLQAHGSIFGVTDAQSQLRLSQQAQDISKIEHVTYQQSYQGLPVLQRTITIHFDRQARIQSVTGNLVLVTGINSTIPSLSETVALSKAKSYIGIRNAQIESVQLAIYQDNESSKSFLAYSIVLANMQQDVTIIMDANDGTVLNKISNRENGMYSGTGTDAMGRKVNPLQFYYGTGFPVRSNWQTRMDTAAKGNYNLVDLSNPELGYIYGMDAGHTNFTALNFIYSNTPSFGDSDVTQRAGVSGEINFEYTLQFYRSSFNRNGIDNAGMPVIHIQNWCDPTNPFNFNAFWDNTMGYIAFSNGGSTINGDTIYHPFSAALEVVAHELTHGITSKTSNLIYQNQSGSLNESISDIFGYLVRAHVYGKYNDWLIGEDIFLSPGGAFRNISNPNFYEQPDIVGGKFYDPPLSNPTQENDYGHVHENSGIPNKVFYLLVNGGSHNGIAIAPFSSNISTSADSVGALMYLCNTGGFYNSTTDFDAARSEMLAACCALFPGDNSKYASVQNAWAAVGVGSQAPPLVDVSWAICSAQYDQMHPKIFRDGYGGAVIVWKDQRSGVVQYNGQRISAGMTPRWQLNGVPISGGDTSVYVANDSGEIFVLSGYTWNRSQANLTCVGPNGITKWGIGIGPTYPGGGWIFFNSPFITVDDKGGVICSWHQSMYNPPSMNQFLARVDGSGSAIWGPNQSGTPPSINCMVPDGSGGVIIGEGNNIERLNPSGNVLWSLNAGGSQAMFGDEHGGTIIAWQDSRGGNLDIYAQKLDGNGTLQWTNGGAAVCMASGDQTTPQIVNDGAGGAILIWNDNRRGNLDIYAQRISAGGIVMWPTGGVPICTAAEDQSSFQVVGDNKGGAIIVWQDARSGGLDIYAQRVNSDGSVIWQTDGTPVCTYAGDQYEPTITSDGDNGAFIAWTDTRNGNKDIYASKINKDGLLGSTLNYSSLTIQSSNPFNGVPVTINPQDISGFSNGITPIIRLYNTGTKVSLTAPDTIGTSVFNSWVRNGSFYSSNSTINITLGTCDTLVVQYIQFNPPPASWLFSTNTGNNATIGFPSTAHVAIGNRPLRTGDAVGAFFMRNDSLICAGYMMFIQGRNQSLTVWGDNQLTTLKDGFVVGEIIQYKVWDSQNKCVYPALSTYQSGGPSYSGNGLVILSSLSGSITQTIQLAQGWNMISSYIAPFDSTIETLFAPIDNQIVLLKDGLGSVYWPSLSINDIGNWNYRNGYQIYMQIADSLKIQGIDLIPNNTPILLTQGWNLIGYLRNSPMEIDSSLSSIANRIVIAKNNEGQVYWPSYSINQIGSMLPGQGYHLYLTQNSTLLYPSNTGPTLENIVFMNRQNFDKASTKHYFVRGNGPNMTLLVRCTGLSNGSEIAAIISNRVLTGAGEVANGKAFLTIWGYDKISKSSAGAQEGDKLILRAWSKNAQSEIPLKIMSIASMIHGSGDTTSMTYHSDEILIADVIVSSLPLSFVLNQNYPNPFNSSTVIEYGLPKDAMITLSVYDPLGRLIKTLVNEKQTAGYHRVSLQMSQLASGVYFYKLQAGNYSSIKKCLLLK